MHATPDEIAGLSVLKDVVAKQAGQAQRRQPRWESAPVPATRRPAAAKAPQPTPSPEEARANALARLEKTADMMRATIVKVGPPRPEEPEGILKQMVRRAADGLLDERKELTDERKKAQKALEAVEAEYGVGQKLVDWLCRKLSGDRFQIFGGPVHEARERLRQVDEKRAEVERRLADATDAMRPRAEAAAARNRDLNTTDQELVERKLSELRTLRGIEHAVRKGDEATIGAVMSGDVPKAAAASRDFRAAEKAERAGPAPAPEHDAGPRMRR